MAGVLLVGMFLLGALWQRSADVATKDTGKASPQFEQVEADVTALRGDVSEIQGKIDGQMDELRKLGKKLTQLERNQLPHNAVEAAEPADMNDPTRRLLKLISIEVEQGMMFDTLQMQELHPPANIYTDDTDVKVEGTPFDIKDFGPSGLPELKDFENERPQP
jgi:hypothetical protein